MIHSLRYEPFGQRQQFEPREQRSREREGKHIHLHLHLHLGSWARARHGSQPLVTRVTRIFAAFVLALSMALTLYLQVYSRIIPTQAPLFSLASNLMLGGALFALVVVLLGGIPLMISAWRSTPRSRFLLFVPLISFGLAILYLILTTLLSVFMQQVIQYPLNDLGPTFNNILLALPFYGVPIISTIALNRAIRRAALPKEWLRFADLLSRLVVLGMLLMLSGVLLWGFALALFAPDWFTILLPLLDFPWNSWLLIFLGMLLAVTVAIFALFSQASHPEPHPHDEFAFSDEQAHVPADAGGE